MTSVWTDVIGAFWRAVKRELGGIVCIDMVKVGKSPFAFKFLSNDLVGRQFVDEM